MVADYDAEVARRVARYQRLICPACGDRECLVPTFGERPEGFECLRCGLGFELEEED